MASSINTIEYILDQAGLGHRLAFRKMFGEYALYFDGKVVALVCDDQLFLKPTQEGKAYLGTVSEAPPFPGAKNFYLLAAELDDPERLSEALRLTALALPEPKIKPKRKAKTKAKAKVRAKVRAKAKIAKSRSSPTKAKKRRVHK
jgi:TfoX/Sxy family transcriptional regulator of competence genes